MRVVLPLSLLLPSVVSAKRPTRSLETKRASRGLIATHLLNSPAWKRQTAEVRRAENLLDDQASEPDVGILAPRNLEEFQSLFNGFNNTDSDFSLCGLLAGGSMDGETCDCDNWMFFMGSISCQGESMCFDKDSKVCGTTSFSLDTELTGNFTLQYCIDLTEPDEHTYCMQYAVAAENVFGSMFSDSQETGSCSLTIDGKQCKSCTVQTECQEMNDGLPVAGVGEFDCSNTNAGTKGNQCDGDSPFPNIDVAKLDIFSVDEGLMLFGDDVLSSGTEGTDDWVSVSVIDDFYEYEEPGNFTTEEVDDAMLDEKAESSQGWQVSWTTCAMLAGLLAGLVEMV